MVKKKESSSPKWVKPVAIIIAVIVVLFMITSCAALFSADFDTGNVAVIPIHGTIAIGSLSPLYETGADASVIARWIEEANENPAIEAIVLDINSGGGAPVASAEIAQAVLASDKLVVAQIREVGASGAYWIASAADIIFAHDLSITGSIGVIGSYLEFSGLLADYNVTYNRQVAGDLKDAGTPLREMTDEERALFQATLDSMHDVFIASVARNRGMDEALVRELATGQIYLGLEAAQNGLVDRVGSRPMVTSYIEEELNILVDYVLYEEEVTLLDALTGFTHGFGRNVGLGIGQTLSTTGNSGIRV